MNFPLPWHNTDELADQPATTNVDESEETKDSGYYLSDEDEGLPKVSSEAQASTEHPSEAGLLDTAETQSAFSDSSDDEPSPEVEGDPFSDFDSTVEHPEAVDEPPASLAEQYREQVVEPIRPVTIEEALIEEAEEKLSPNAIYQGAVLPFSGREDEITRRDAGYLRHWKSTATPPGRGNADSLAHSHGMPSRFKAESNEKAERERLRIARDLARKQLDTKEAKLADRKEELQIAADTARRLRRDRDDAAGELKWTREEMEAGYSKAAEFRMKFQECEKALKTKEVEVETWKKAFEKQKPLAMAERERQMRKKLALEDSRAVGTQTETHSVGTSPGLTANFGEQTEPRLDIPFTLPLELRFGVAEHLARWLTGVRDQMIWAERDFMASVELIEEMFVSGNTTIGSLATSLELDILGVSARELAQQIETCLRLRGEVPVGISIAAGTSTDASVVVDQLLQDGNQLRSENVKLTAMSVEMKELVHKYNDLQLQNLELRLASDEDAERLAQSNLNVGMNLENLDRFIEHGRALKAECDRLSGIVEELQFDNEVLKAEVRRPRQPSATAGTAAEVLDQFMEHARELKAECDRLTVITGKQQQELRCQAKDLKQQLAESEDQRKNLASEKGATEEKYRCSRQWISTDQTQPLPYPCTPLPVRSQPVVQAQAGVIWEQKRIADLRNASSPCVVSVKRRGKQTQGKVKVEVEVKLEMQNDNSILGISWKTLVLLLIFFFIAQWLGSCLIVSRRQWQL